LLSLFKELSGQLALVVVPERKAPKENLEVQAHRVSKVYRAKLEALVPRGLKAKQGRAVLRGLRENKESKARQAPLEKKVSKVSLGLLGQRAQWGLLEVQAHRENRVFLAPQEVLERPAPKALVDLLERKAFKGRRGQVVVQVPRETKAIRVILGLLALLVQQGHQDLQEPRGILVKPAQVDPLELKATREIQVLQVVQAQKGLWGRLEVQALRANKAKLARVVAPAQKVIKVIRGILALVVLRALKVSRGLPVSLVLMASLESTSIGKKMVMYLALDNRGIELTLVMVSRYEQIVQLLRIMLIFLLGRLQVIRLVMQTILHITEEKLQGLPEFLLHYWRMIVPVG
jgi:hypothetical protein